MEKTEIHLYSDRDVEKRFEEFLNLSLYEQFKEANFIEFLARINKWRNKDNLKKENVHCKSYYDKIMGHLGKIDMQFKLYSPGCRKRYIYNKIKRMEKQQNLKKTAIL